MSPSWLAVLLILGQFEDWATTEMLLYLGYPERNPLAAPILTHYPFGWPMLAIKLVASILPAAWVMRYRYGAPLFVRSALLLWLAVGSVGVLLNIVQLAALAYSMLL